MTVSELANWVLGLYGFVGALLLAILTAVLGGGWWLRGQMAGFREEIQGLRRDLNEEAQGLRRDLNEEAQGLRRDVRSLAGSLVVQTEVIQELIGALLRQNVLDARAIAPVLATYTRGNIESIQRVVREEEGQQNPLTRQELDRLKFFISKAERGELFNGKELSEYNALVAKLKEGRGSLDPGVMALVGLGDVLLGIWIGRQGREPEP